MIFALLLNCLNNDPLFEAGQPAFRFQLHRYFPMKDGFTDFGNEIYLIDESRTDYFMSSLSLPCDFRCLSVS